MKRMVMVRCTGVLVNPEVEKENQIISLQAPPNSGVEFPKTGVNLFYGKSTVEEYCEFMDTSLENPDIEQLDRCELRCAGFREADQLHWFDHYAGKTVFDIRRLSVGKESDDNPRTEIVDFFGNKAEADFGIDHLIEVGAFSRKKKCYTPIVIELFPQYIDDLRAEKEWMAKIDLLIWRFRSKGEYDAKTETWIRHGKPGVRATLFDSGCVVLTECRDPCFQAEIPEIKAPIA